MNGEKDRKLVVCRGWNSLNDRAMGLTKAVPRSESLRAAAEDRGFFTEGLFNGSKMSCSLCGNAGRSLGV